MTHRYVMTGPCTVAAGIGYWNNGRDIPDGRHVVVHDCREFADGGSGPALSIAMTFRSRELADAIAAALNKADDRGEISARQDMNALVQSVIDDWRSQSMTAAS